MNKTDIKLPLGFRYAGVTCGIKASGSRDVCLIVSDHPTVAAGVYTQNQVVAAPVILCRSVTPSSDARALVVNSGNANACTGEKGMQDARRMCGLTAELTGIEAQQVLVMSTGIIGHFLPMEKVESGIRSAFAELDDSESAFLNASDAILTTDQGRKIVSRQLELNGSSVTLAGMAKGAGMIGPNMATLLCAVLTDAPLSETQAQSLLKNAADLSFNSISVEGHTSTNDSMVLFANGQANKEDAGQGLSDEDFELFATELNELCIELAKKIPTDGEGATHLIEVQVTGTATDAEASTIARAIASSNLVKTAVYGNDPNWGRIVSAAGYAGPKLESAYLQLKVNGAMLFVAGEPVAFDEADVSQRMRDEPTTQIELMVGGGTGKATHWSSDLTVDYVKFNSDYTT